MDFFLLSKNIKSFSFIACNLIYSGLLGKELGYVRIVYRIFHLKLPLFCCNLLLASELSVPILVSDTIHIYPV